MVYNRRAKGILRAVERQTNRGFVDRYSCIDNSAGLNGQGTNGKGHNKNARIFED